MNLFDFVDGINPTTNEEVHEGIRLHKLELYNWGTFDKAVWTFTPNGNTSLLTGESGSGKSTIVDALTTLFMSPRKIAYNKAADDSAKERTVNSYVRGYYGRKYAFEGKGKPEALREKNSYSVILATFKDMIERKTITLAMFFWFKDNDSSPTKMYIVSEKELFIAKDFANFNSSIKSLKDSLKNSGAVIFNDYKHYAEHYRKLMGEVTEQAITLFQQTISMKEVAALNEFVRGSMLEKEDIEEHITTLLKHYHNLNTAYGAVVKAKAQIEKLVPINISGTEYAQKIEEEFQLDMARQSLELWFATRKTNMIDEKIVAIQEELEEITKTTLVEEKRQLQIEDDIQQIKNSINQNGGEEIERLTTELSYKRDDLNRRESDLSKYNKWVDFLNLRHGTTIESYNDNLKEISSLAVKYRENKNVTQGELTQSEINIQKCRKDKEEIDSEIKSLRSRSSNIPRNLIELRDHLCSELKVNKEMLPFAGELLEVKESEIKWEGAIERLSHGFAISLLVPEKYYGDVALWVNKQSIGTKLVYFRTGKKSGQNIFAQKMENTVASKLRIKENTVFTDWISNEIEARFAHICCETIDDFKKESKAITITGQIKSNIRHEKDDRRRIDDRTRYVLGFSNKKKLEILMKHSRDAENELCTLEEYKDKISKKLADIETHINVLEHIIQYDDYNMIDVGNIRQSINDYEDRIKELQKSNSTLQTLREQLGNLEKKAMTTREKVKKLNQRQGSADGGLKNYESMKVQNQEKICNETQIAKSMYPFISQKFSVFVGNIELTLDNAEQLEKKYSRELTNKCGKLLTQLSTLKSEIEKNMAKFRNDYPSETYEINESVESIKEYDNLLKRLQYHNLPKYQEDFKQELQGKIIQHISMFNGMLSQHRKNISARISEINDSLYTIDYNTGRYITIVCEDTPAADIRVFRNQLKACTEGMASGIDENEMAESKFMQIKEIIERFKGRPEYSDADKKWTEKVTDVRNWFVFSASERLRENDVEYEHYSDSDGKSGGQKEKLAYTILAASLVYNYRLNKTDNNGSSFRLVVIDEAFLKSSDDSAKYGLKLFEKLKFQLIVVTPLLKISTIEPFISHVGFVTQSDITHRSTLKNIPMEIYKQKRKEWEENDFIDMEQTK